MKDNLNDLRDVIRGTYEHGCEFTKIGKLPNYIPELSKVNEENIAISIRTIDGDLYHEANNDVKFTIQSMVKVIVLICALEKFGEYRVFKNVGLKPSSQAFNSVVGLELSDRIPVNPFINAGAIVLVSLLGDNAYEIVLEKIKILADREDITYSKEVFESEFKTGETNRALSYLMKASGNLSSDADVEKILGEYFKLCSILVDTKDLANIGAVLANGGKSYKTGDRIIDERDNHIVTTLMATCGMYDYSGEFAMAAGIPAKSGVSGGILSLSFGNMGIAVYSPGLDSHGNSVSGIKMLSYLSNKLDLNIYKK